MKQCNNCQFWLKVKGLYRERQKGFCQKDQNVLKYKLTKPDYSCEEHVMLKPEKNLAEQTLAKNPELLRKIPPGTVQGTVGAEIEVVFKNRFKITAIGKAGILAEDTQTLEEHSFSKKQFDFKIYQKIITRTEDIPKKSITQINTDRSIRGLTETLANTEKKPEPKKSRLLTCLCGKTNINLVDGEKSVCPDCGREYFGLWNPNTLRLEAQSR